MPAALQLTATQDCAGEISGATDKKGNAAELDGDPTFTSSDPSKVTIIPISDTSCTLSAVGPVTDPGTNVVISIDGDGKLGPEVFPIHDEIAVTVVAGDAVSFGISLSTPTEQP